VLEPSLVTTFRSELRGTASLATRLNGVPLISHGCYDHDARWSL